MNLLLVSPLGYPINAHTRYAGIERLVFNYACELHKQGHDVIVMGHGESIFPEGIRLLRTTPKVKDIYLRDEIQQYQTYQTILHLFDVIHDFSHQHLICRFNSKMKAVNVVWHAPNEIQYPKSPYNIVCSSKWACQMYEQYYKQKARYQQTTAIDINLYKPSDKLRTDRFLTLGIMSPAKGNLKAIQLCKQANVPLDVCGSDSDQAYKKEVMANCDGDRIRFLGEVSLEKKVELMQTCKALIYATERPEVMNHKVQESLLCGTPVIAPNIGALPEIITHAEDGLLCDSDASFVEAIKQVDNLTVNVPRLQELYSLENVVSGYVELYKEVAKGLRW